jgi:hypothetical protein
LDFHVSDARQTAGSGEHSGSLILMQFLKPVARANKKARLAPTRTGLGHLNYAAFTKAGTCLQPEESI